MSFSVNFINSFNWNSNFSSHQLPLYGNGTFSKLVSTTKPSTKHFAFKYFEMIVSHIRIWFFIINGGRKKTQIYLFIYFTAKNLAIWVILWTVHRLRCNWINNNEFWGRKYKWNSTYTIKFCNNHDTCYEITEHPKDIHLNVYA